MSIPIVLSEKLYTGFLFRWLTYLRPISEFRIGGFSFRESLEILGYKKIYYDMVDDVASRYVASRFKVSVLNKGMKSDVIFINPGLVGTFDGLRKILNEMISLASERGVVFYHEDGLLGIYLSSMDGYGIEDIDLDSLKRYRLSSNEVFLIRYPWDIPEYNNYLVKGNKNFIVKEMDFEELTRGVYIRGSDNYLSSKALFDAREGPIILDKFKEIDGYAVIKGPVVIREGTYVFGGKISNSIIGPVCKVGGEVADSLINGYSNMQHHSYIGHSYIGEWVNIGAGTVFSDLKNTYGTIRMEWNRKKYDTGSIKVGSFVGDHVKISINTSIFAGKLIGCFSHLYGLVTDNVPPFTIWDGYNKKAYVFEVNKAIDVAKRVYQRRSVRMSRYEARWYRRIFELTQEYRNMYNVMKGNIRF